MTINDIKLLGLEDSNEESKADFSSPEKNQTMKSEESEESGSENEEGKEQELPKYQLRISALNVSPPKLENNKSYPVESTSKRLSEFTDTQKKLEEELKKSGEESSEQEASGSASRAEEKSAVSSIKVGEDEIEDIMQNENFDHEIDSDDEVDMAMIAGLHGQTFNLENQKRRETLEQIF
mmetsp:Transcript_37561/g.57535  ORF Transcript_37561/g.57535 Transcript_37561/m.57535 type:complete len:180 (-) Transcript_37561:487-1026(-)|eukprot:CAMPEP_0170511726 /NCGR_PEP_ID=MMETSP0208-20121228/66459_1 /TAXON_ID=197538 /ORGANISM="Strombidium inclinatum, Strain S3" /LENGTH=179 /DNA_ID=CAMNT_0010795289 /DNA_START=3935 /DNA_END=4474 /DNA_ORIENTATION=-